MRYISLIVLLAFIATPSFALDDFSNLSLKETAYWLNSNALGKVETIWEGDIYSIVSETRIHDCKIMKTEIDGDMTRYYLLRVGTEGLFVPIDKLIMYKTPGHNYKSSVNNLVLNMMLIPSNETLGYPVGQYDVNPMLPKNKNNRGVETHQRFDFTALETAVDINKDVENAFTHWVKLCSGKPPAKTLNRSDEKPVQNPSLMLHSD